MIGTVSEAAPKTWILTGSLENFLINVERDFDVIGLKERRIRQAEQFRPDDLVIFYVTGIKAFGGIARVLSPMFEDLSKWPAEHWTLAFQGQLRTISDRDTALLEQRMSAAASVSG